MLGSCLHPPLLTSGVSSTMAFTLVTFFSPKVKSADG